MDESLSHPIPPRIRLKVLSMLENLPTSTHRTLEIVLSKMLAALQAKDEYGFFLEPVDVTVVTDYLSVIKHPMDFSAMQTKLTNHQYPSFSSFQEDFELICANAMTYNAPSTIYFRSAQKLLGFGRRLLRKESVRFSERLLREETRKEVTRHSGRRKRVDEDGEDEERDLSEKERRALEAKVSLFRRGMDGSWFFSSKNRRSIPGEMYSEDGSLVDIGNEVREMLVGPYHSIDDGEENSAGPRGEKGMDNTFFGPFPLYDSKGYLVDDFETSALSLAYGDPKGREFVRKMEMFCGNKDGWVDEQLEKSLDYATLGGHAFVKNVERIIDETDHEKEDDAAAVLSRISQLVLELSRIQMLRFKRGNPGAVSLEERKMLVNLKHQIASIAKMVFPRDLVATQACVQQTMDTITSGRIPGPYQGTLQGTVVPFASNDPSVSPMGPAHPPA